MWPLGSYVQDARRFAHLGARSGAAELLKQDCGTLDEAPIACDIRHRANAVKRRRPLLPVDDVLSSGQPAGRVVHPALDMRSCRSWHPMTALRPSCDRGEMTCLAPLGDW
jgi:hypothetical protein